MEILNKIKSVKLCLMAHPDNEIDSEFADRISDLEEIESELLKNDWIKIESENDLPNESYVFWTLRRGFKYPMYKYVEIFTEEEKAYWLETYEYYQPIKKPDLPLT